MAGILQSNVATYEFSLAELAGLIASDLEVATSAIKVEYVLQEVGGDPFDRYPGVKQVTKIRVTVTM